ncbi:MAG: substrate-binding domain-containing protein [Verrucomicrobiota bacterium]
MKKHLTRTLPLAVLGVTVMLLGGCSKSTSSETKSDAKERVYTIGMSQCNLGEPWRVQMNEDIKAAAAKHPNLKVVFKDAQNDTLKQRAHVEEFVSSKVDLLIISPKEAQPLTEPVALALAAGVPVIVLDRALLGDKFTCFIGANNKQIGKAAGEWVVKVLGRERQRGRIDGVANFDARA